VAILQVKNLPDELYDSLRRRAAEDGTTVSALVTRILKEEQARPTLASFRERWSRLPGHGPLDVVAALDADRAE
jgi:hypothetical protein